MIHRREGHPRRQQHPPEEHDGLALRPGGARRVWEQRAAAAPKARHLEPGNVSHGRARHMGRDRTSQAQRKLPRRELPPATLRRLAQGDPEEDPCLPGLDVLRAGRRKLNLSEHEPHLQEEGIRRVGHQETGSKAQLQTPARCPRIARKMALSLEPARPRTTALA